MVSFDDSVIARLLDPELTTVAIPANVVGEQAFLLLLGVLEEGHLPTQVTIPLELVVRESTAAVNGGQREETVPETRQA